MTTSSFSRNGMSVFERRIDHGGRHHHPDGAGRLQLPSEVFKRRCADRTVFDERLHGFRMDVVNNALVTGPQKALHHVGSHPAQSDHAQFHQISLPLETAGPALQRCQMHRSTCTNSSAFTLSTLRW